SVSDLRHRTAMGLANRAFFAIPSLSGDGHLRQSPRLICVCVWVFMPLPFLLIENGGLTTENAKRRGAPVVTGAPHLLQGVEEKPTALAAPAAASSRCASCDRCSSTPRSVPC